MDLTPLVPVLVGLLTAVATLGGVWITQDYAERGEKRRRKQDQEDQLVADLRTEARRVSDLFLAESLTFHRFIGDAETFDDFNPKYERHLIAEGLFELGQAINMVPDADARAQLRLIVKCLPEDERLPPILVPHSPWAVAVHILLDTGQELSSAYARGEKPDLDGLSYYRPIEAASAQLDAEAAAAKAEHPANLVPEEPMGDG